jgi:Methyltransferase FkbM domain
VPWGLDSSREKMSPQDKSVCSLESDSKAAELSVQCRTLESIFDDYRLEQVDLAKVDIEGSEDDALRSTRGEVIGRIARMDIEIHNDITAQGYSFETLRDHLKTSRPLADILRDRRPWFRAGALCSGGIVPRLRRGHNTRPRSVCSAVAIHTNHRFYSTYSWPCPRNPSDD